MTKMTCVQGNYITGGAIYPEPILPVLNKKTFSRFCRENGMGHWASAVGAGEALGVALGSGVGSKPSAKGAFSA